MLPTCHIWIIASFVRFFFIVQASSNQICEKALAQHCIQKSERYQALCEGCQWGAEEKLIDKRQSTTSNASWQWRPPLLTAHITLGGDQHVHTVVALLTATELLEYIKEQVLKKPAHHRAAIQALPLTTNLKAPKTSSLSKACQTQFDPEHLLRSADIPDGYVEERQATRLVGLVLHDSSRPTGTQVLRGRKIYMDKKFEIQNDPDSINQSKSKDFGYY